MIITKIIASHLKTYFPNLISHSQSSFLTRRRATDNAIIIQDFITLFAKMKGEKANMILKIDLEKAFDKIEWSFIRQDLYFFNILNDMIKLIISCISTSSISILINGGRKIFSDLLSPYLFIMCMELLSRRINHEVDILNWIPISINAEGHKISHLFIADDLTCSLELMGKIVILL